MVDFQELELDEMADWPLIPQCIVVAVLFIIIQGLGTWFYLQPKEEAVERLIHKEEQLKSTVQIKANKAAALPQMQHHLDQLSERYDYLSKQLPVQKELASMLASVNELGLENALTFTRIDWGEKQNDTLLYKLPLNMELTGTYHDIGQFAEAIARLPRIINLQDVDWHRVSQESSVLHFRVRAFTYQFKPEVKDEG
ncbi:type 4a pilus biogenesis protein PilO [Vibrio sp.]|nr:type 4a pilus biogenesis protein PilO [Vibrio sp.]